MILVICIQLVYKYGYVCTIELNPTGPCMSHYVNLPIPTYKLPFFTGAKMGAMQPIGNSCPLYVDDTHPWIKTTVQRSLVYDHCVFSHPNAVTHTQLTKVICGSKPLHRGHLCMTTMFFVSKSVTYTHLTKVIHGSKPQQRLLVIDHCALSFGIVTSEMWHQKESTHQIQIPLTGTHMLSQCESTFLNIIFHFFLLCITEYQFHKLSKYLKKFEIFSFFVLTTF